MSASKSKDSTVSEMNDLFGDPPLIRGEDKARYRRLHSAIENDCRPKSFADKIYVRELADKLWQHQRCKQSAASIVDGAYIEALASLLRPFIIPQVMSIGEDAAAAMARDYYSGDTKAERVKEVDYCRKLHAISDEQIRAKAMQLCGNVISMFNRMETNCEASLRMLRKERVRRNEVEDKKPEGSDESDGEVIK